MAKTHGSTKERHRVAAMLIAMGWRKGRVAKFIGVKPPQLSIIQHSPLFSVMVEQFQREFISKGMANTIDKIIADGPINVDFIREIRDGLGDAAEIEDPTDRVRHRLKAAELLLDRQAPKRQEQQGGPQVIVNVEAAQRSLAEEACLEVGEPIDVTPKQKRLPPPVRVRDLDEMIQSYEELASDV